MILKIIKTESGLEVYEQIAGQFCNPKKFSGLAAKIINWLIDNWLKRG